MGQHPREGQAQTGYGAWLGDILHEMVHVHGWSLEEIADQADYDALEWPDWDAYCEWTLGYAAEYAAWWCGRYDPHPDCRYAHTV